MTRSARVFDTLQQLQEGTAGRTLSDVSVIFADALLLISSRICFQSQPKKNIMLHSIRGTRDRGVVKPWRTRCSRCRQYLQRFAHDRLSIGSATTEFLCFNLAVVGNFWVGLGWWGSDRRILASLIEKAVTKLSRGSPKTLTLVSSSCPGTRASADCSEMKFEWMSSMTSSHHFALN